MQDLLVYSQTKGYMKQDDGALHARKHRREEWISVNTVLPEDGITVRTKIDDERGVRNDQPLKRQGRLWFFPDGSMYVYYVPTHWQTLPPDDFDKATQNLPNVPPGSNLDQPKR